MAGVNILYSQNQGGDVRRAGAQIRYRLQFVVVQLSARNKIIIKTISLLRVRLSGRPGMFVPEGAAHARAHLQLSQSLCSGENGGI